MTVILSGSSSGDGFLEARRDDLRVPLRLLPALLARLVALLPVSDPLSALGGIILAYYKKGTKYKIHKHIHIKKGE